MTRVLIVDDDPGQLRMLAHIIAARRRDLCVVTANTGSQAIEALRTSEVDLVLTDLQMPEMSGFELLTWLVSNRPQIPIFTMTAYPDAESVDRLDELGAIECFTKPLDITTVLQRVSVALTEGVGGHVRNIGLAAFLQLVEMERKTCVLTIESEGRSGLLHLDEGVLVDARTEAMRGDAAALEIATWPSPAITIRVARGVKRRTVQQPLAFILLEAMRKHDERRRSDTAIPVSGGHPREAFPLAPVADAETVAIIDFPTGKIQASVGDRVRLEARAGLAVALFRAEVAAVADLRLEDEVGEMVFTTNKLWTIVRPIAGVADTLAMLVFDPMRSTLVMQRLVLDEIARQLRSWCFDDAAAVVAVSEDSQTQPIDAFDELADWGE